MYWALYEALHEDYSIGQGFILAKKERLGVILGLLMESQSG